MLSHATRHRADGALSDTAFDHEIGQLILEELEPNGMKLLMHELSGGRTGFIIKEQATGTVCDMLNFDAHGVLESDSSELLETPLSPK